MKLSIKDLFSKCNQIRSFLRIWSYLLKKSSMENIFFCAVTGLCQTSMVKLFKKLVNSCKPNPGFPLVERLGGLP